MSGRDLILAVLLAAVLAALLTTLEGAVGLAP